MNKYPFPTWNSDSQVKNKKSKNKSNSISTVIPATSSSQPSSVIKYKIIFISGISGVGKTVLGKRLEETLENAILIDQDMFFIKKKPIIRLSSGEPVINYDSIDSIDWEKLNYHIEINLQEHNIILVGFALWKDKIKFTPDFHFLLVRDILVDGKHNIETLKKFCYEDRQLSKRFRGKDNELLMITELVIPFYFTTLSKLHPSIIINTYENNSEGRIPLNILVGYVLKRLPEELY